MAAVESITSTCEACDAPIPQIPGRKHRRFCGDACRMRFRRRGAATAAPYGVSKANMDSAPKIKNEQAETPPAPANDVSYDASSIKVLGGRQLDEKFTWQHAKVLAARYPHISPEHIERLLEACDTSGWSHDLAERKYLAKVDPDIETPFEMMEAFKQVLSDRRYRCTQGAS